MHIFKHYGETFYFNISNTVKYGRKREAAVLRPAGNDLDGIYEGVALPRRERKALAAVLRRETQLLRAPPNTVVKGSPTMRGLLAVPPAEAVDRLFLLVASYQLVSALILSGALGFAFLVHQPVDGMELLRQCWFTLIMLGTFRYFYAKNTVIY